MSETIVYQMDPDVVRWGPNHPCSHTRDNNNAGSCQTIVTRFHQDLSFDGYAREGYCEPLNADVVVENDEIIARALQEELSALAAREACGYTGLSEKQLQASVWAQHWLGPRKSDESSVHAYRPQRADTCGSCQHLSSPGTSRMPDETAIVFPPQPPPDGMDDTALVGEVEKRLDQMVPIPHVPRTNGDIPSDDDADSDHQRLLGRLKVYELVELKVKGDGNCQFRSLSDQIYRTEEHQGYVRQAVVNQLKSHPEMYEGYVPMPYGEYLKRMTRTGEWGDHVTLQAAADTYGIKIFVLTSYKDTCYIEILPRIQKSNRVIFLSFWAEVHYNSIYPEGEFPEPQPKKTRQKLFAL